MSEYICPVSVGRGFICAKPMPCKDHWNAVQRDCDALEAENRELRQKIIDHARTCPSQLRAVEDPDFKLPWVED